MLAAEGVTWKGSDNEQSSGSLFQVSQISSVISQRSAPPGYGSLCLVLNVVRVLRFYLIYNLVSGHLCEYPDHIL